MRRTRRHSSHRRTGGSSGSGQPENLPLSARGSMGGTCGGRRARGRKAKRQNIGVTFNLCHWLKVDGKDLRATLTRAKPCLSLVTINGADSDGQDWGKLIQPLDTGTYDVAGVLRVLVELNYQGPIGLQHYGIGGDCRQNLERSMNGRRKLSAEAATGAK